MARNRKASSGTAAQTPPTTTNQGEKKMPKVLDLETINALLAGTRERGIYDEEIVEFLESGEAGWEVDLGSGRFAGKKASNVKTGLDNARTRVNKETGKPTHDGGHNLVVRVIGKEDAGDQKVFLINKSALEGAEA